MPLLMLWAMNPATDKSPIGAPENQLTALLATRPGAHAAVIDKLLAANPDLSHKGAGTKPEMIEAESTWWETIEVPVKFADGTASTNMVSVDYEADAAWVVSFWADEKYIPTDTIGAARAFASALTRAAALCEYMNGATK